jgi:hypothetical protein
MCAGWWCRRCLTVSPPRPRRLRSGTRVGPPRRRRGRRPGWDSSRPGRGRRHGCCWCCSGTPTGSVRRSAGEVVAGRGDARGHDQDVREPSRQRPYTQVHSGAEGDRRCLVFRRAQASVGAMAMHLDGARPDDRATGRDRATGKIIANNVALWVISSMVHVPPAPSPTIQRILSRPAIPRRRPSYGGDVRWVRHRIVPAAGCHVIAASFAQKEALLATG